MLSLFLTRLILRIVVTCRQVKLWNTSTGFCVATFSEHSGGITGITFGQNGVSIITSSLDGTVRAFDRIRYRNFRTFTTPTPTQVRQISFVDLPQISIACVIQHLS
jgi:WD40 repeat protein